jgi:putative flippase GtrA
LRLVFSTPYKSKQICYNDQKMRKFLKITGDAIRRLVDYFYPPFRKYMDKEFFRYGVTGVANLVFDWVLYFCIYHFILHKEMLHLGFVTLSSHIAALAISFPVSFMTGFLLQKYVTFTGSEKRGGTQLYRYGIVVLINLAFNYFGLKLLVDFFGWFATPSKMGITLIATAFSYFSQKKYTFK